jgi:hypothetical protein
MNCTVDKHYLARLYSSYVDIQYKWHSQLRDLKVKARSPEDDEFWEPR